jgi:two-component system, OmpR family, sensor histidine kinase KdpD
MISSRPIEMQIPAGLPLVKADPVLMEQALANLVHNAVMHTPAGTPIEIRAHVDPGRKILVLQVADRGPGLPPDQLETIFEPFHRAASARPGGTGLGLAIVKGFVEAQGGQVVAANCDGGGAVFTISLPTTDPLIYPTTFHDDD